MTYKTTTSLLWHRRGSCAKLGSHPDRFAEYNHQIRQEYAWVNGMIYHFKRKAVLKGFYQKKRIYVTDYFYDRLESEARMDLENIAN